MTKPAVSKHWRKPVGRQDQVWIPPEPLNHVTVIQLYATASMHGVRVPMWQTQSVGPVRTVHVKCAADCEHCVTQSSTELNFQTITITRILSSGGEGGIHEREICKVRTDIQMLFSRTCKDQIPGFSRTQKSFFPGLSRKRSIQNIGCTRSKSAYIKSVMSVSA